DRLAYFSKLKAENTWKNPLKNEKDFQQHSTELLLPKLNNGLYLIVAKVNNKDNTYAYTNFQVTNIAVVEKTEQDKQVYQFIDRNNGKPLSNLDIQITYFKNYRDNTNNKNYTTNALGEIELIKGSNTWSNIHIEASCSDEKAFFGDYYLNRKYEGNSSI